MSSIVKKGLVIYNKSDSKKNIWFIEKMIDDAMLNGLNLSLAYSDEIEEKPKCDFAIMRDRSWKLSKQLEDQGIKVFNNSLVCKVCNDKLETYNYFKDKSIPLMYTQQSKMPYPFVLKPRDGHGGQYVYLIENKEEYEEALLEINNGYYNSEVQNDIKTDCLSMIEKQVRNDFIYQIKASETGKDLRVYVLGDKILTSMKRSSASDFRANFSLGGSAMEVALSSDEMKIVAKVKRELDIDFGGIDLIYNNGQPVLNEIEDVVGTRMLYEYTDIDASLEYMKWIAEKIKD